jgi:hypothetical protein
MTVLLICLAAALLAGLAARITFTHVRRSAPSHPLAGPPPVTSVRLLREEHEVHEAARRAREREQLLARAAVERAARFDALTSGNERLKLS